MTDTPSTDDNSDSRTSSTNSHSGISSDEPESTDPAPDSTSPPVVDGRNRDELLAHMTTIAPFYTPDWDPGTGDVGFVVAEGFAELAAGVVERLDRVPEKHHVEFLDRLGFSVEPPQASRLPLAFQIAEGVTGNVTIPPGTQAVAEATDVHPEQTFEVAPADAFEATPATLTSVFGVDPGTDHIVDHREAISLDGEATLFGEPNRQEHVLYLGHESVLTLGPGSPLRVSLETAASASLFDALVWEYYGERDVDGETVEDWHELGWTVDELFESIAPALEQSGRWDPTRVARGERSGFLRRILDKADPTLFGLDPTLFEVNSTRFGSEPAVEFTADRPALSRSSRLSLDIEKAATRTVTDTLAQLVSGGVPPRVEQRGSTVKLGLQLPPTGTPVPYELEGVESRWIRARLPPEVDPEPYFDVKITGVSLTVGPDLPGNCPADSNGTGSGDDGLGDGGAGDEQDDGGAGDGQDDRGIGYSAPVGVRPDALFHNDVPLPVTGDADDVLPFGEAPHRLDTFAIASDEAFSKPGTVVVLRFTTPGPGAGTVPETTDPRLSWEYATADGWRRLPLRTDGTDRLRTPDVVVFSVPDDMAKTTVAGHEAHWIRVRLAGGDYGEVTYRRVRSEFEGESDGSGGQTFELPNPPVADVTVRVNGSTWTRVDDLSTSGSTASHYELNAESGTLTFGNDVNGRIPPDELTITVSYLSGTWERVTDGVAAPRFGGLWLRYGIPPTEGSTGGAENGGDETGKGEGSGNDGEGDGDDVIPGPLTYTAPAESIVAYNNLAYSDDVALTVTDGASPFIPPPDTRQAVYFGFDGVLTDGPLQVLLSLEDKEFPESFHPRVRWEYCVDPDRDEWSSLDVRDETESLTRRGIVGLVFPDPTVAVSRFGQERHWIRARVTDESFLLNPGDDAPADPTALPLVVSAIDASQGIVVVENRGAQPLDISGYVLVFECAPPNNRQQALPAGTVIGPRGSLVVTTGPESVPGSDVHFEGDPSLLDESVRNAVTIETVDGMVVTRRVEGEPTPCGRTLSTALPSGDPDERAPVLRGVTPNTGWAFNVRTVADETLGSSDGTPDQTFTVGSPPVTEGTIWVDEHATLSEPRRRTLLEADPEGVKVVTTPAGEMRSVWVRWTQVEDFLDSSSSDRHHVLDRAVGRLTFGDGIAGRVPPRGRDNVRATYTTGGGVAGNVSPGAVTALVSSIAFVDAVTNPEAGDGGAAAEDHDGVLVRAAGELRDRGRAVTVVDFERVASSVSRTLARVKCLPGVDDAGERAPGWITLLVVPDVSDPKPVPSVELRDQVRRAVSARAPTTLVDPEERLVVRGPRYVPATVSATVETTDVTSVSAIESAATAAVSAFLHPLTGGTSGTGWDFGELPCLSDLYGLLEGVEGVDHVADLTLTFEGEEEVVAVTDGESVPDVASDVLVFGGTHDIEARSARTALQEGP